MSERICPTCKEPMKWEPCEGLDCDDGYDDSDCLGIAKCSWCNGRGGEWHCYDCESDYGVYDEVDGD